MKLLLFVTFIGLGYGQLLGGGIGMPGGKFPQDSADPKWIATLSKLGLVSSNAQVELVGVSTQVVAGVNTYYNLKVNGRYCEIVLFDQSWTNTHNVTFNNCTGVKRAALTGGWSKADPNDSIVMGAVNEVLDVLNAKSNSMFRMVQNGEISVQTQVVSGLNLKLSFLVGASHCRNTDTFKGMDASKCPLSATNSLAQKVTAEVWFQAWRTPKYIITHGPEVEKDAETFVEVGKDSLRQVLGSRPNGPLIGQDDGHDCAGLFADFVKRHERLYATADEERKRYKIFCKNMWRVKKLQDSEKGTAKYGATKFADLTEDEFKKHVGYTWDLGANQGMKKAEIPTGPIPTAFDWRKHNAVTGVKNQGSCGSCWAFSTTGNIEGQWAIKKNKLVSLSEQELVDCDKLDDGCEGGLPSNAYKEIERLGGMETEKEYSYQGQDEKCRFLKSDARVYINSSVSISSNETEMAAWLAKNGPISIGINANVMQFYWGGISHPWSIFCNPKNLDHGVLIVGYGVENDTPYWIIKNSWGPDWGEDGYYRVYRGDGVCGLNNMCTSAVVD